MKDYSLHAEIIHTALLFINADGHGFIVSKGQNGKHASKHWVVSAGRFLYVDSV